jgi:hypothetical protein
VLVEDFEVHVSHASEVRHEPGNRIVTVAGTKGREWIIDLDPVAASEGTCNAGPIRVIRRQFPHGRRQPPGILLGPSDDSLNLRNTYNVGLPVRGDGPRHF